MKTVVVFLCLVAFTSALPFEAHISEPNSLLVSNDSFVVSFSLTNTNEQPLTICRWGTPLDENSPVFRADMFSIVNELDISAVYTGILMKRRLGYSDVLTLQPGQTVTANVDLQNGYWFEKEGKYFITLQSYIYIYNGDASAAYQNGLDDFTLYDLSSSEVLPVNVVELRDGTWKTAKEEERLGAVTPSTNCPSANATNIRTADTNAATLARSVVNYLAGACNGGKYVQWMGACDSGRYSTVRGNFNAISSRIGNGYRVDCAGSSCSANVYAYVYPSDTTFTVYVCGAFWGAPASTCSWDSRPGTIIHEISHFSSVAGTGDQAYGRANCENLARTNPAQAVRNADNHEYLSESCPP